MTSINKQQNLTPTKIQTALSPPPPPPPMAAVRDRRLPHLTLTLDPPIQPPAAGTRFSLPPLPPSTAAATAGVSEHRVSDFDKLAVLGHGNGGTVYKVRHRRTAAVYALKIVNHSDSVPASVRRREVEILKRVADSDSVVRLCSSFYTPAGDLALLMELMDAGSLDSLLTRRRSFSEPALAEIARQVLLGFSYLHAQKIAHRDIKPSNLLINSDGQIKIADFGVSKLMHRSLDTCVSYVGTCAYMSPERFDPDAHGGEYDAYAADVWSLGLTLMELHLGHFPLLPAGQRPDWSALMWAICFGEPPAIPESASEEFRGFIGCCLNREAGKRWAVGELIGHPFVTRGDQAEAGRAWMELLDPKLDL